ncbi:hypothetical protein PFMC_00650 [Plasmodium falciparum CAMP/Malaysia]|uniref:Uncharacterized protein n=1 Tax=Plasmodium falciparum (isolate Camp / Malaysia) TaxID=5835 RepID=A0A024XE35_PLAFC|nr:hypothetical protein PFMC_00650 [Plasmodium falciparum CAMP/Malaysia]
MAHAHKKIYYNIILGNVLIISRKVLLSNSSYDSDKGRGCDDLSSSFQISFGHLQLGRSHYFDVNMFIYTTSNTHIHMG